MDAMTKFVVKTTEYPSYIDTDRKKELFDHEVAYAHLQAMHTKGGKYQKIASNCLLKRVEDWLEENVTYVK